MADLAESRSREPYADPSSLRRALRRAIGAAMPEIHIAAEGFLAEVSPIDWLAIGAEGELVAIRVAAPEGDPETLTHLLGDLSWLRPRREDFLKLAPGLGIDPTIEPRAVLLAATFQRETRAAVDNFPRDTVQLWRWLPGLEQGPATLRVEPIEPGGVAGRIMAQAFSSVHSAAQSGPCPDSPAMRSTRPSEAGDRKPPLTAPPSPSAFRTGLRESDLLADSKPTAGGRVGVDSDRPVPPGA